MRISNNNVKTLLRTVIVFMIVIGATDIIISQTSGSLGAFFKGYSALIFPFVIVATYTYVGLPIFHFDGEAEVLHIRSHFALGRSIGKELYVPKSNIISFEIDRKRIRKKLTVNYMKNGKEFSEKFSITLLGNRKIEELAKEVELINAEQKPVTTTHLFI